MTPPSRLATYFHIHLVSDSTGETLNAMARAVCARFDNVLPIEHIYALVRSPRQLERVLGEIDGAPGVVLHTIVDEELRGALETRLPAAGDAAASARSIRWSRRCPAISARRCPTRVGAQYSLDNDYFNRMDALTYAIGHDDGQGGAGSARPPTWSWSGSPRRRRRRPASISPTAACAPPMCRWCPAPGCRRSLFELKGMPIVGLTVSPDRLIQIRRNRLRSLNEDRESAYVDTDAVRAEIVAARRLFERQGWPVIDVTRRSVEETAAAVINILSGGRGQVEVLG